VRPLLEEAYVLEPVARAGNAEVFRVRERRAPP
jgi:hypothetical protein